MIPISDKGIFEKPISKNIPYIKEPFITVRNLMINLCDEALKNKAIRQHRLDFLTGDTGRKGPLRNQKN